jgi:isochorismate synthase EntC
MRVKKILSYVKLKVKEYPKIDSIIEGLELSKETQSNRDINSFIKSKNKINRTTEIQAVKNISIDKKIEEYRKWQKLIQDELKELKIKDNDVYKIVFFKFTGYSFDKIKDELYLGERTVINLYNDFIIEITLLAIKNGLIHI